MKNTDNFVNKMDINDSDFGSDTSSDDYAIQKKALDVQLPEDFNPNAIPQTGEEYLQHVIYERTKKCRKWVTAKQDFTVFNKNQTVHITEDTEVKKALDKFYPSRKWQDKAFKDFTELRNFIHNNGPFDPKKELMITENFLEIIEQSPPKFSDIKEYCQAAKIKMLEEIISHLDEFDDSKGLSHNLGAWIYAILALLVKPLSPSCCSTLRDLAKKCANIRAKFGDTIDKKIAVPLNLFICVIARYFNQLDLMDPV